MPRSARPTLSRPTWASVLIHVRTLDAATYEALYHTTQAETLARYARARAHDAALVRAAVAEG